MGNFTKFLEKVARNVIRRCRREAIACVDGKEQPVIVYVPGGDNKYPSFWLRDAAMECASGVIPLTEMVTMIDIIFSYQNDAKVRRLENGLVVHPWAFPDHINLKGIGKVVPGAVFFPGTYDPSDNQGAGRFGNLNVADSPYEVVELAYLISTRMNNEPEIVKFLNKPINRIPRIERLDLSFNSVNIDSETGLHFNQKNRWAAESFHDVLIKMGFVLLSSCLRFRAAKRMAEFYKWLGEDKKVEQYITMSKQISENISHRFILSDGWLMVATEVDKQADVWGTSLAVYEGILKDEKKNKACQSMLKEYLSGTVAWNGYLRGTPTTYDAVPGKQVWEDDKGDDPFRKYGIYIDGGYWPQPVGWYVYALSKIDTDAARKLTTEFIDHTRRFLREGSPFEWISPSIPLLKTPGLGRWYGPSAALPLSALKRLGW